MLFSLEASASEKDSVIRTGLDEMILNNSVDNLFELKVSDLK